MLGLYLSPVFDLVYVVAASRGSPKYGTVGPARARHGPHYSCVESAQPAMPSLGRHLGLTGWLCPASIVSSPAWRGGGRARPSAKVGHDGGGQTRGGQAWRWSDAVEDHYMHVGDIQYYIPPH